MIESFVLLLYDSHRVVRTLVCARAAVHAFCFVDDSDIIDRNCLLRADIRACTASNTFVNIDLGYHSDTSPPLTGNGI